MSAKLCGRLPILTVVLLAAAAVLPLTGQEPQGKKYALLVGVREYDPNELRNLNYTEADVTGLSEALDQAGYKRVVLMTQALGASQSRFLPLGANIRSTLKSLLEDRRPEDSVLVAFAGHGVQFKGSEEPYFCPMDARLADRKTLISLTEVYQALKDCPARHKLLLVDACRNDPQSDNSRALAEVKLESVTRPQMKRPPGGVAALFSCSKGEKAYESPRLKHGVFFHYVIKGLRGEAANARGVVTVNALADYVQGEVRDHVKEEFGEHYLQKPHLVSELEGVMTLLTPGSTEAALPKEVENSIGLKLVRIPAGKFTMGSPQNEADREPFDKGSETQHEVQITRPFYMGVYEVTQAQYERVMGENPSYFSAQGGGKEKVAGQDARAFPVENVSWEDAVAFCRKLSDLPAEKAAGRVYVLPTEAEWEYACRGGAVSYQVFHYGNSLSSQQANFNGDYPYGGAAKGPNLYRTSKVGSYPPNAFGLCDMHGNVFEWCADWYDKDYHRNSDSRDPKGPNSGDSRVLRGGSWSNDPRFCRAAVRVRSAPGNRDGDSGFRVLLRPASRTP